MSLITLITAVTSIAIASGFALVAIISLRQTMEIRSFLVENQVSTNVRCTASQEMMAPSAVSLFRIRLQRLKKRCTEVKLLINEMQQLANSDIERLSVILFQSECQTLIIRTQHLEKMLDQQRLTADDLSWYEQRTIFLLERVGIWIDSLKRDHAKYLVETRLNTLKERMDFIEHTLFIALLDPEWNRFRGAIKLLNALMKDDRFVARGVLTYIDTLQREIEAFQTRYEHITQK